MAEECLEEVPLEMEVSVVVAMVAIGVVAKKAAMQANRMAAAREDYGEAAGGLPDSVALTKAMWQAVLQQEHAQVAV